MSSDELETRMDALRKKAAEYSKAQGHRVYLEEFKKSKLAILQKKYEPNYPSVAAQEREARADHEYDTFLKGLEVSVAEAERLRWELEIARIAVDLWRTQQANQRIERRGYGA